MRRHRLLIRRSASSNSSAPSTVISRRCNSSSGANLMFRLSACSRVASRSARKQYRSTRQSVLRPTHQQKSAPLSRFQAPTSCRFRQIQAPAKRLLLHLLNRIVGLQNPVLPTHSPRSSLMVSQASLIDACAPLQYASFQTACPRLQLVGMIVTHRNKQAVYVASSAWRPTPNTV